MKCTCKFNGLTDRIEYCPMHGAAEDMYEALKVIHHYARHNELPALDAQIIAGTAFLAMSKAEGKQP